MKSKTAPKVTKATPIVPGEVLTEPGDIELNVNRETLEIQVSNSGDRPIQVGSHYHFFETNQALVFNRESARGFRLNIPAGTAVRFEPGQKRTIELVALAGDRIVYGFQAAVMGALDQPKSKPRSKKPIAPKTKSQSKSKKVAR